MKTAIILFAAILLASCQDQTPKYSGPPVIVKKVISLNGKTCTYTYIGLGREDWFEDPCDKWSVGDTLKGN